MLVDTENLVSAEEFRAHMDEYIASAANRSGPLALMQDAEVVGFFVSARDFDAMYGAAVRNLLAERSRGATVGHKAAREQVLRSLSSAGDAE